MIETLSEDGVLCPMCTHDEKVYTWGCHDNCNNELDASTYDLLIKLLWLVDKYIPNLYYEIKDLARYPKNDDSDKHSRNVSLADLRALGIIIRWVTDGV